jgi:cyclic pyranopterin phosphate synthase
MQLSLLVLYAADTGLAATSLLTFEEIRRVVSLFVEMGVEKIRLSGGEPVIRCDIDKLVEMLVGVLGVRSISMTTNVFLLAEKAAALKTADSTAQLWVCTV